MIEALANEFLTKQGLSLEEKRRLAMEAESMQRYKSQSAVPGASLTPMSGAAKSTMSASKPRDLTDTLMSQVGCGPCSRVFALKDRIYV